MEQLLIEYLVNALWQIPLLALGGWLLQRALKGTPAAQHALWLAVLVWAVLLPAQHLGGASSLLHTQRVIPQTLFPAETASNNDSADTAGNATSMAGVVDATSVPAAMNTTAPASVSAPTPATSAWWSHLRLPRFTLTPWMAHAITGAFLLCIFMGLTRILLAMRGNRRLLRGSTEAELANDGAETFARHCRSLRFSQPALRTSPEIVSPLTLGHGNPVIVLPEEFAAYTDDQLEAALCHELAHIERRDYLVNFFCQLAATPIAWHPVTHLVERRIGQTREILCDRMASRMMSSELRYAHSLFTLAQSMFSAPEANLHAQTLFNHNPLEERIMHLTEAKPSTQLRSRILRAALGVAILSVTVCLSSVMHVTPVLAQSVPAPMAGSSQSASSLTSTGAGIAATDSQPPTAENSSATLTLQVQQNVQSNPDASIAPQELVVTQTQNTPQAAPQPSVAPRPPAVNIAPLAPLPALPAIHAMPPMPSLPAMPPLPVLAPLSPAQTITLDSGELSLLLKELPTSADCSKQVNKALRKSGKNKIAIQVYNDGRPPAKEVIVLDGCILSKADARAIREATHNAARGALAATQALNDGEFQRSMEQMQRSMAKFKVEQDGHFRQQMEELKKQLNSKDFQLQIEQAKHTAINQAELQKQIKEMNKHHGEEVQRALKQAQKELEQSKRELEQSLRELNQSKHALDESLRNLPAQPAEPPQPETSH